MLQLLADRFVCDRGRWFDLATARPVSIRVEGVDAQRHEFDWHERCAVLWRLRHPLLNPLLDYGYAAANARFEAYAIMPPLRAGAVAASHAATHAVRFLRAHAIPLNREFADLIVRPFQPGGRCRRPFGIVLQHRKVLDVLAEVLESGGAGLTAVTIAGPPRSGMSTVQQAFARAARLAGYVPVAAQAAHRWPQLPQLTTGRHLCVMSGDEALENGAVNAAWFARLGIESSRRHLHLSFVRRSDAAAGALRLDPLGVTAMTSMVYVDPDLGPSARELFAAARGADGWPGRFLAALGAEPFDTFTQSPAPTVHETPASYVVTPALRSTAQRARGGDPAETVLNPADRTRPTRMESALSRAEHRAAMLAAAGRHGAAVRLLERAIRLLSARGRREEAGSCALRLAWIARGRGDIQAAFAQVERARALTADAGIHADAAALTGILWTDEGRFVEAEAALRAAVAAAAAVGSVSSTSNAHLRSRATLGLARALFWQGRTGDAMSVLDDVGGVGRVAAVGSLMHPEAAACEGLVLAARIHAAEDDVAAALGAASQAGEKAARSQDGRISAAAHRAMAVALNAAGDIAGAQAHIRSGLQAAAAAHLPLTALRLRALWLTTLNRRGARAAEGPRDDTDEIARRLREALRRAVNARRLPHVVRVQIDAACGCDGRVHNGDGRRPAAPRRDTGAVVAELVDASQRAPDDHASLARVLEVLCERVRASSVLLLAGAANSRLMAAAGRTWRDRPTCAQRALDSGLKVPIDRGIQPPETAEPVKYAGTTIAAIACRWPAGTAVDIGLTEQYLAAAALAVSTHVQTVLEAREPPAPAASWGDLLGESPAAAALREVVQRAAKAPFPVLVEGESGSGKELVARAIHRLGSRRDRRFCAINCAAITDELVEAELFGHARGAFTGAAAERAGLFEEADGGSLFLDEVGELSARAQAKLLRVLQDGEVRRVGENFPRRVDVRVIAATNRRLEQEVAAGRFRTDLRFRLDVIRITVPPLRDRVTDIPLLAAHFWHEASSRVGSHATLGPEAIAALSRYDWPGNVRELQNAIAWMAVHAPRRGRVGAAMIPAQLAASSPLSTGSFEAAREDFERRFVRAALAQTGGHRTRTAEVLGVSRQGLAKMLRRLRIE